MAKYIVPPRKKKPKLVRCFVCHTLYQPDTYKDGYYEKCPICGTGMNDRHNVIPLWYYNLIRYWRGLFNREQPDAGGTDD